MRRKMSNMKEMKDKIIIICNVMGKKNNQISVSYADREIPTRGSTYNAGNEVNNAGNEVNLVSGIIC